MDTKADIGLPPVYTDVDSESEKRKLNDTFQKKQTPASSQSCFQKYSLQLFVANFSLLQLAQMTSGVYWIGVIRTIEKRFGLSSTQSNFVMSVNDIVHICLVVFIGYFGRKSHKPRIMATTSLCLVVGAALMASPYFIYGGETPVYMLRNESSGQESGFQYCDQGRNDTGKCDSGNDDTQYTNTKVWYIFLVASVFNGIGGVAMQVLGMAYVDENADKTKSAFYLGIVTSTFALGPITGIFLAAFATLLPENLETTDKTPRDPTWIGAWWLGYVICAIVLLVATIPMFFYPKHIIDPDKRSAKAKKKYDPNQSLLDQMKEFPKALLKLLSNKAYLCMLVTAVTGIYVILGVFVNIPRYLEIHFLQPAFKANIGAALPGLAGVFGGFIGGAIMTRLKFGPVQSAKMVVFAIAVTLAGLITIMFITCPQLNVAGDWNDSHKSLSVDTACNSNCSCATEKNLYQPVCDRSEDLTYFSPCHAGCTNSMHRNGSMVFTECTCTSSSTEKGVCQGPCDTQFILFAAAMFVLSFLSSLGRVPGTVVQFRIVGEDDGSFALGVTSFMINLLGFVPGPLLFGKLIDSTCVLWQDTCGQRGACLFYDTNAFKYLTYGVSAAFQLVSFAMSMLLVFAISKMDFSSKKDAEERELHDMVDSKGVMLNGEK